MSWMDSWSRPSKSSAVPPPLYLTSREEVTYCKTCGRVMSSKPHQKLNKNDNNNVVKYCSDRCRRKKPGAVDRQIEHLIVALLDGEEGSGIERTGARERVVKGDKRLVVTCEEVEELFFGRGADPKKTFGRRKNRASRAIEVAATEEEEDDDGDDDSFMQQVSASNPVGGGVHIRPAQTESEVNGSIGGEKGWAERKGESAEGLEKRHEGDRRAEEREMVRRAARRGVVFGLVVEGGSAREEDAEAPSRKGGKHAKHGIGEVALGDPPRRKCEAVMNGKVVEPSFAKGNWSIRWRE